MTDSLLEAAAAVRVLAPGDERLLQDAAANLFDYEVEPALAEEFLRDPRHHIAVALVEGRVAGFASAVHYVHPDKPAELWINEVGVAPGYRRRGIARSLLEALRERGRELGCRSAWVLTERDNVAARRLYESCGGREEPGHGGVLAVGRAVPFARRPNGGESLTEFSGRDKRT